MDCLSQRNIFCITDYDKRLNHMITFFVTDSTILNTIWGIKKPDDINFYGDFDKMSCVFNDIVREYENKN